MPVLRPVLETVAYQEEPVLAATAAVEEQAEEAGRSARNPTASAEPVQHVASADGITLEMLEQLAMQHNPAVRQICAAAARASGIRAQVGLRPNPRIGYFGDEIGNEGDGGLHGAFLSQRFVRGDKLAWNRQVHGHDVEAMRWQAEAQRHRVRTDIRVRFYEALAAQQRLQLAREFRKIVDNAVVLSEERLAAEVAARPDVLQSQMQLSEIELAIQQAEFEWSAAWTELTAIAGLPQLAPSVLIGELAVPVGDHDLETVYAWITSESPRVAAACARVRRARSNLHRQRAQPIPNVTAQVGAGYDDTTGNEFANVGLSLPVPFHNRNQGNICAADAEYCEATRNVQRIKMQIRSELARVMREFQVARATVAVYEASMLPKAEETLQLMQQAQEAGEFDFLRVLTARRTFFDVNGKYVTALCALAKANAKIEGLLLTGGLSEVPTYEVGDDLRGQALSGQ